MASLQRPPESAVSDPCNPPTSILRLPTGSGWKEAARGDGWRGAQVGAGWRGRRMRWIALQHGAWALFQPRAPPGQSMLAMGGTGWQ